MSAVGVADIAVDEQLLLQFVVWNLRVRDLPFAVRDAAAGVAATQRHPRPSQADVYIEAPFRVSVIPQADDQPVLDASADRAHVPALVAERLLELRPKYLLITDLGEQTA